LPLSEFYKNPKGLDGREFDCKACLKERRHGYEIKRVHGISAEDYARMLSQQGGGCAICGAPQKSTTKRRLHVDHDHVTGKVRGLLCSRCNVALGYFGDDPNRLLSASAYLLQYSDQEEEVNNNQAEEGR
jgi:hypothetical protein